MAHLVGAFGAKVGAVATRDGSLPEMAADLGLATARWLEQRCNNVLAASRITQAQATQGALNRPSLL